MNYNVYYNEDYVASKHAFDTTRKSAEIAKTLVESPPAGVSLVDPSASLSDTLAALDIVHDKNYIQALDTGLPMDLAESQGFPWDEGVPIMATAHSSGLVAAVDDVLIREMPVAGSLSSGLHHARSDRGEGYCTYNGLAVAAVHASTLAAERILVLDFDAHGGGGTRSILDSSIVTQIDVSTSPFDEWRPEAGTNDQYFFAKDDKSYLEMIDMALFAAGRSDYDLVLYNAGMDPINTGISREVLVEREQLVAQWAAGTDQSLVYALAGGYTWGSVTMEELVALHRLTIDSLAEA
jgi:acetoin utilization deacetylase AcuC-like enzyme